LALAEPFKQLRRAWAEVEESARSRLTGKVRPTLPEDDISSIRRKIDRCLSEAGGAASARARAASLGGVYLDLELIGQQRFLRLLAEDYGVATTTLHTAVQAWLACADDKDPNNERGLLRAEQNLRKTLRAPRMHLLTQFNELPQGVKFLADMRSQLLSIKHESASLNAFDKEFKELLATWFDVGFLELQRITWDAPAALLENLANHEAVHAIRSWQDIKHRLAAADRCCYALIHPQMPNDPLIFVWVALTNGIADNIQQLLRIDNDEVAEGNADTAIFYSISATQPGLNGVGFGSFLIKRVVDELTRDHKQLRVFATLSPIPGFRPWLEKQLQATTTQAPNPWLQSRLAIVNDSTLLSHIFSDRDWLKNQKAGSNMQTTLLQLGAYYLLEAKQDTTALDSVANFHLSNGASIERLNWKADISKKGQHDAAGLMVNYRYRLKDIETNHERYHTDGNISRTKAVDSLLKA
jgi:malonyl-CoA decarboxylase